MTRDDVREWYYYPRRPFGSRPPKLWLMDPKLWPAPECLEPPPWRRPRSMDLALALARMRRTRT